MIKCCAVCQAEEETRNALKSTIEKYYATSEKADAVTKMWDHLQASLQCCGVDNYQDFAKSEKWAAGTKTIPESCCVLDGDPLKLQPKWPTCTTSPNDINSYYNKVRVCVLPFIFIGRY